MHRGGTAAGRRCLPPVSIFCLNEENRSEINGVAFDRHTCKRSHQTDPGDPNVAKEKRGRGDFEMRDEQSEVGEETEQSELCLTVRDRSDGFQLALTFSQLQLGASSCTLG